MNKLLTFTRQNVPFLFLAKIAALLFFSVAFTQLSFGQGCPNLVTNGDFTQGSSSFTSAFATSCNSGSCIEATYCVSNNFQNKCSSWSGASGAPSLGNFMSVDGATTGTAPYDVWRYTPSIPVVAGKSYMHRQFFDLPARPRHTRHKFVVWPCCLILFGQE